MITGTVGTIIGLVASATALITSIYGTVRSEQMYRESKQMAVDQFNNSMNAANDQYRQSMKENDKQYNKSLQDQRYENALFIKQSNKREYNEFRKKFGSNNR